MAPIVAAFSGENQQSMYLGVWRFNARKPALLLGDGEKCASKVSKSGLLLHALWLALPLPASLPTGSAVPVPVTVPLEIRLNMVTEVAAKQPIAPTPPQNSVLVERVYTPVARPGLHSAPFPPAVSISPLPQDGVRHADTAATHADALRQARSIALEAPARRPLDNPAIAITVETAVAHATAPDVVLEKRGTHGAYVTESKHARCVTQLTVPHYMSGMAPPTLCEAR